jgi:nucleotide-binding universal stress UspA family protein
MLKPTRVLVPTDFSEYSDRALGQALEIARQYKAKVFLLHVVHEDIYRAALEFTFLEEAVQRFRDGTVAWARDSLQKQLGHFPQAKEVEVATNVRCGIPYNEILREGKEQGIDLIVIASLGRSGIAKYVVGSVARNVLKGSKCPVLLTR